MRHYQQTKCFGLQASFGIQKFQYSFIVIMCKFHRNQFIFIVKTLRTKKKCCDPAKGAYFALRKQSAKGSSCSGVICQLPRGSKPICIVFISPAHIYNHILYVYYISTGRLNQCSLVSLMEYDKYIFCPNQLCTKIPIRRFVLYNLWPEYLSIGKKTKV